MTYNLSAYRYTTARSEMLESFGEPANIGIRCSLPGWLQRVEITVKAKSRADAYERYVSHLGHGFAIADSWLGTPIVDGWCYEIVPDGMHVVYIIGGAWKRHSDQYEQNDPGAVNTDAYIKSVLSGHVPAVNSDQSNISGTSTSVGSVYRVDPLFGTNPDDIIEEMLKAGNSSDAVMDYYTVSAPFDGTALQNPYAYLQARSNTASIDWQVNRADLASLSMSRNIWNLANNVQIGYTQATTLSSGAASGATSLTVSSITGFSDNDEIRIEMDSGSFRSTTINGTPAGSTINIDDALTHAAASGNQVIRVTQTATSAASATSDYWTRYRREYQKQLNQTQAQQYRDALLAEYKDPAQETSFSIGAPYVRNGNGALYPLWRLCHKPGYIRINDLFPEVSLFDTSRDRQRVFFMQSLDYDHASRRLRVVPDAARGDRRLDILLQRLGSDAGQTVSRA